MPSATADTAFIRRQIDELGRFFAQSPQTVAYHTRDAIEHTLAHIRRSTFRRTTIKGDKRRWLPYKVYPFPGRATNKTRKAFDSWEGSLSDVHGQILERFPVVTAHEYGATITPKTGDRLAIPIQAGMRKLIGKSKPNKVLLRTAGLLPIRRGGKLQMFAAMRGGRLRLYADLGEKTPKGKVRPTALFSLVSSVTLKPRLGANATARTEAGWIAERIRKAEARIIEALNRRPNRTRSAS